MLLIKTRTHPPLIEWHVGDPIPEELHTLMYPVASIQIDGHELSLLLEAMEHGYLDRGGVVKIGSTKEEL